MRKKIKENNEIDTKKAKNMEDIKKTETVEKEENKQGNKKELIIECASIYGVDDWWMNKENKKKFEEYKRKKKEFLEKSKKKSEI